MDSYTSSEYLVGIVKKNKKCFHYPPQNCLLK